MRTQCLFAMILGLVAGCGSGGGATGDDDPQPGDAAIDAPPLPEGFTRLIGRTWTLQPGEQDIYKCVRFTVQQDTYITTFQAQPPPGTHHTVLSIAGGMAGTGPDGEQDCSFYTLGSPMLYASGLGPAPLVFPDGVGIRVAAGTQLHLNLHLYNSSDRVTSGDSAILVKAQPTPPPTLAEMVFAGTFSIQIPGELNQQPHTETGGCTLGENYKLFALWPHMHQLGTRQRVELIPGSPPQTPQILLDEEFQFEEQDYYRQNPEIALQKGDQIRVTCTWRNTTGNPVGFGESSDSEMCFSGMYRYPAPASGSDLFSCVGAL